MFPVSLNRTKGTILTLTECSATDLLIGWPCLADSRPRVHEVKSFFYFILLIVRGVIRRTAAKEKKPCKRRVGFALFDLEPGEC